MHKTKNTWCKSPVHSKLKKFQGLAQKLRSFQGKMEFKDFSRLCEPVLFISLLTCRCNTSCFLKLPQDLLSHIRVSMVCSCSISGYSLIISQLSELVWKVAGEKSLQLAALGSFPFPGTPANGNEINAKKSRFCSNRTLTGTIYYWSVILRSFSVVSSSAKRDANGFFKVLLVSSHLLNSRHPVIKSKFGTCAVTAYCC